jgi:HSP20 family molecular chaperone IbpA
MKKFNLKTLFFLFTVLIISGCETIPPGTAPEGPIVKVTAISDRAPVPEKAAINVITTELITQPFIINSKKTPSVMFIPTVFDRNSPVASAYNSKFNNLTLNVYSRLFTNNLIIAPQSIKEYDYALLNGAHENPLFSGYKKGYKTFTWEIVIFSKDNDKAPIWAYSLNVLIPEISKKEIDQNTEKNNKIIEAHSKESAQKENTSSTGKRDYDQYEE